MKAEDLKEYEARIAEVRKDWTPGPWDDEPNRAEWRYKDLPCLIVRNRSGALCGYVGVPPGHPVHGKHYDDVEVDVHGGLTFSAGCHGAICHVPEPGEPDAVWWLGFDCAHCGDAHPWPKGLSEKHPGLFIWRDGERYWSMPMVKSEVERLADQLAAMAIADNSPQSGA